MAKTRDIVFPCASKVAFAAHVTLSTTPFLKDDRLVVVSCTSVRGQENRYYVQNQVGARGYFYESDLISREAL